MKYENYLIPKTALATIIQNFVAVEQVELPQNEY